MKHVTTVLVVDDRATYEMMAPIIAAELDMAEVLHADSEAAALALLHSHQPLDLIFSDWDLAGLPFVRAVREELETHFTPVVVMSAEDRDHIIANAMRAGATDHMAKPFIRKGLINKLHRLTRKLQQRRLRRVEPQDVCHIHATINGQRLELELVDISLTGCQTRLTLAESEALRIYQSATIEICRSEGEKALQVAAKVLRLAADKSSTASSDRVLLGFEFTDLQGHEAQLNALLDHLRERWHQRSEQG